MKAKVNTRAARALHQTVAEKFGVKEGEKAVAVNVPSNVQMALGKGFITQTGAPARVSSISRFILVAIDDIWAAMRFKPAK